MIRPKPAQSGGQQRLIAVIGAPAAGKSTLSRHLHNELGAKIFRLREFADSYRREHPEQKAAFATSDPLGWFPDATVVTLLTAALPGWLAERVVVLENLPGNGGQLAMLRERAVMIGARLDVVVLVAPDRVLTERARTPPGVCRLRTGPAR